MAKIVFKIGIAQSPFPPVLVQINQFTDVGDCPLGSPAAPAPCVVTLVRLLGDFDPPKEAMHKAIEAALRPVSEEGSTPQPASIAMCDGPEAGLTQIDAPPEQGELGNYYLAYSARADMYRMLGGQVRPGPLMRDLWR